MNEESAFLIQMSCFVVQIVILFGFYFAALRRLFIPPTPSNILVLGIVLIGIPGLLLVFIWGWIRHRRMKMTQLMSAWSVAFALVVTEVVILSNYEKSMPLWMASAVALLCLSALG